jgi:hypothetical protein
LTTSATFAGAVAASSDALNTTVGVGALKPARSMRDAVTVTSG